MRKTTSLMSKLGHIQVDTDIRYIHIYKIKISSETIAE